MSYGKVDPKIDGAVRALRGTVAADLAQHQRTIDTLVTGIGNMLIELVELKRRVERLEAGEPLSTSA
jgi:hypothetical protein